MFGTILLSVCTAMHLYCFWRADSVPFVKRRVSRKILSSTAVLIWIVLVAGRIYGHHNTGGFAAMIEVLGMTWLGILFLTTTCLMAVDLVTGFGYLFRSAVLFLRGSALILGGLLSMVSLVQGLRPPVVTEYDVAMRGLPASLDGTVIAAVSDLHLGSLLGERWLAARVAQIEAQRPDMVFLLGDLFEGHGRPEEAFLPIFRRLTAPFGVWIIPGNHEHHGSDGGLRMMQEAGFHLLRNRWAEVRPGLILAGMDDFTARRREGRRNDLLSQALSGRPAGATILLSHTPWYTDEAARAGVGLMLSGHTHGGQIWPFGYLVRLVYPLLAGRYQVDGMTAIVCRGTGTWGPRMRLWRPGEILRVTVRAPQNF